jgi:hypothetical protein
MTGFSAGFGWNSQDSLLERRFIRLVTALADWVLLDAFFSSRTRSERQQDGVIPIKM